LALAEPVSTAFHAAGLRGTHAGLRGTHIYIASAHDQNKECRFPREKLGQTVSLSSTASEARQRTARRKPGGENATRQVESASVPPNRIIDVHTDSRRLFPVDEPGII